MVERVILNKSAPAPLASRINAALDNANSGSADWCELLAETELAISEADAVVLLERSKAIDISASPSAEAAQDALARASAAAFNRDRLQSILPRMREKLTASLEGERHARWLADYRKVEAERDALAAEFAETYPNLVAQLADLFGRMDANGRRCAEINSSASALQNEHRRLLKPELHARGLDAFSRDYPEISKTMVLPDCMESGRNIWPPKQPSMAAEFAGMAVPYHPGAAWSDPEVREQRRQEVASEHHRIGEFYQQQTKDQEERVNREERQRSTR
jgi:hypothetical protein